MKILFISRAYPPTVGGIENQNYELSVWLAKNTEIKLIANRHGKIFLPFFLPYALIRALFSFRNYDVLLLGDGVLGIIGWCAKLFYDKPVISVIHGLDLTYKLSLYQKLWVGFFIKKLDKLIAVGNETVKIAQEKGLATEKIVFIPNGIDAEKFSQNYTRTDLEKILGTEIAGKKILLTSGRLAQRKGVAWFIDQVMPKLAENILYVVAGEGPDRKNIEQVIAKNNLSARVKILGYIPDEQRNILFNTCDLFIQPNIKIPGDVEGFGISVLEAAVSKIPVIASKLEGLKDAIQDGQNGFLIEPMNVDIYVQKINALLADDNLRQAFGAKARAFTIENYSWDKIAQLYLAEIEKLINLSSRT